MKSFKQFLKENEELKNQVEEKEVLDEAKMDWGNVVNEVTGEGLSVSIINQYSEPEIRIGQKEYAIKGMINPYNLDSIEKRFGSVDLTGEQKESLKQEEVKFKKELEKMEANIQKDMIKVVKKYEDEIKKVLKKYNAEI